MKKIGFSQTVYEFGVNNKKLCAIEIKNHYTYLKKNITFPKFTVANNLIALIKIPVNLYTDLIENTEYIRKNFRHTKKQRLSVLLRKIRSALLVKEYLQHMK